MYVCPKDEERYEPPQIAQAFGARLHVHQPGERDAQQHDGQRQRPDEELRRTDLDGQGQQQTDGQNVQSGPEQPGGDPGVKTGQHRGGQQQQAVPAGLLIDIGHAAFGQPLVIDPGATGAGEAERVLADDFSLGEHLFAVGDVPERARIAEHRGPAGKREKQKDGKEKEV